MIEIIGVLCLTLGASAGAALAAVAALTRGGCRPDAEGAHGSMPGSDGDPPRPAR